MLTITTKYHGPTNTRGARISAQAGDLKVTIPYPHELSGAACHAEAVKALIAKHAFLKPGVYTVGELDRGYAFVPSSAPSFDIDAKMAIPSRRETPAMLKHQAC